MDRIKERKLLKDHHQKMAVGYILAAILFILGVSLGRCHAAEVHSRSGVRINVSAAMQGPAQCLVNRIESSGHRIRFMRGYGHGTVRGSLHPAGNAIDIDQTARNVTKGLPRSANRWAHSCGLVSGGDWLHNPDFGHFQLGGWTGYAHHRVTGFASTHSTNNIQKRAARNHRGIFDGQLRSVHNRGGLTNQSAELDHNSIK